MLWQLWCAVTPNALRGRTRTLQDSFYGLCISCLSRRVFSLCNLMRNCLLTFSNTTAADPSRRFRRVQTAAIFVPFISFRAPCGVSRATASSSRVPCARLQPGASTRNSLDDGCYHSLHSTIANLVLEEGLEPLTCGLSIRCSAS